MTMPCDADTPQDAQLPPHHSGTPLGNCTRWLYGHYTAHPQRVTCHAWTPSEVPE